MTLAVKHLVLSYRVCRCLGWFDERHHDRGKDGGWVCRLYEWAIT